MEIAAAEVLKGKTYTCPALKPPKGKEVAEKEEFLFDISKAEQIFDYLLKDKQIRLPEGHRIPSAEDLRNKKYCKWHHSYSHNTVNCMVFRNVIQKAIKEGRFKLAEKGAAEMKVDTDPFPVISTNMVGFVRHDQKLRG